MLLILLLCPLETESANLLLVSMDQGRSHATSFAPFMHRLQRNNHTVSLYFNTYKPEIDFGMKNELIDLSGVATSPFEAGSAFFAVVWRLEYSFVHQIVPFYSQSRSCKIVLEKRQNEFARLARGNWDLVFADSLFAVCGYGIALLNRRHHVMIHSSDVEGAHGTAKAFHRNYGILPPNFMSYAYAWKDPSYFLDRVKSATDWFGSIVVTNVLSDQFMRQALSPVVRDFSFPEFLRTSTYTFTDMPELLYPPAPRTNDTINNLTDYRIVWSYNGNTVNVGGHVMLSKWIPQNDLLLHNRTVLFLSHGGLKSVKEAACSGTPSLFMPMFAEQMRNAWLAKNKGYAEILNKFELSNEYLEKNIRNVLNNPKYQDMGKILKEVSST
ncbi:UDP-glucoronosyl and UDP-glucosyl transferase, partial [Ancylostoma caninum]